jgi:hypothetical protein
LDSVFHFSSFVFLYSSSVDQFSRFGCGADTLKWSTNEKKWSPERQEWKTQREKQSTKLQFWSTEDEKQSPENE